VAPLVAPEPALGPVRRRVPAPPAPDLARVDLARVDLLVPVGPVIRPDLVLPVLVLAPPLVGPVVGPPLVAGRPVDPVGRNERRRLVDVVTSKSSNQPR
jgi:hypothetical protein